MCAADFRLRVDVPFPFSVTPTRVLEAAGNAAVKEVLAQLMDVLARSMVSDHKLWLQEGEGTSVRIETPGAGSECLAVPVQV